MTVKNQLNSRGYCKSIILAHTVTCTVMQAHVKKDRNAHDKKDRNK